MVQIKNGCAKQICFSKYCKNNVFSKKLSFSNSWLGKKLLDFSKDKNDGPLMQFAMDVVKKHEDPEELICSQSTTLNRNSLKIAPGK